jgi:hypothetical protein
MSVHATTRTRARNIIRGELAFRFDRIVTLRRECLDRISGHWRGAFETDSSRLCSLLQSGPHTLGTGEDAPLGRTV